jgi:hypothetical protein
MWHVNPSPFTLFWYDYYRLRHRRQIAMSSNKALALGTVIAIVVYTCVILFLGLFGGYLQLIGVL